MYNIYQGGSCERGGGRVADQMFILFEGGFFSPFYRICFSGKLPKKWFFYSLFILEKKYVHIFTMFFFWFHSDPFQVSFEIASDSHKNELQ